MNSILITLCISSILIIHTSEEYSKSPLFSTLPFFLPNCILLFLLSIIKITRLHFRLAPLTFLPPFRNSMKKAPFLILPSNFSFDYSRIGLWCQNNIHITLICSIGVMRILMGCPLCHNADICIPPFLLTKFSALGQKFVLRETVN